MADDDRPPPRLCRRSGEAVFCRFCDGDGMVVRRLDETDQPVKCGHCGGEGLEPRPQGDILKLLEDKTVPQRGLADLSPVQRREIVELVLRRHRPYDDVARLYNVKRPVVTQIIHNHRMTRETTPEDSLLTQSILAPRKFSWEAADA